MSADRTIVTSRLISAPRERVWQAWTDPAQVALWWGPNGFTNTITHMTVEPGGRWEFIMHGPDGTDYPNLVVFQEVVEPERLVYVHGESDDSPDRFHNTITFEEQEGKTFVTMHAEFPTVEAIKQAVEQYGAIEGGRQTLGRLEEFIASR